MRKIVVLEVLEFNILLFCHHLHAKYLYYSLTMLTVVFQLECGKLIYGLHLSDVTVSILDVLPSPSLFLSTVSYYLWLQIIAFLYVVC